MHSEDIGAAAGRKCQSILDEILWPTTRKMLVNFPREKGLSVFHLSAGSGVMSAVLSKLFGHGSTITTFGIDKVILDQIQSQSQSPEFASTHAIETPIQESEGATDADLILGRVACHSAEHCIALLAAARRHLKPGGLLCLEVVDFSRSQSFPNCYALNRYRELLQNYRQSIGMPDLEILKATCRENQFHHISVKSISPGFLAQPHVQLPALVLEYLSQQLITLKLISRIELLAIITELRLFANQYDTLISAPAGFRLAAYKI